MPVNWLIASRNEGSIWEHNSATRNNKVHARRLLRKGGANLDVIGIVEVKQ